MTKHLKTRAAVVVFGVMLLGLGWGGFVAAKTPAAPPTIDQVLGTWSYTASTSEYELATGASVATTVKGTATITSPGDYYLSIDEVYSGGDNDEPAYYSGGIIFYGWGDDQVFGNVAGAACLVVTGKPGKLTAKGQEVGYDDQSSYMYITTYSFKQTATH